MSKKREELRPRFDPGRFIFTWEAHDYHPHERGWIWLIVFCLVLFGSAIWALWNRDWIMAFTFFFMGGLYFFAHRNGHETHHINIYDKYLQVDKRFYPWKDFSGYWFVYEERQQVAVINFQLNKKTDQRISLQMGHLNPVELREILDLINISELEDKQEGLVDLWVRALKL